MFKNSNKLNKTHEIKMTMNKQINYKKQIWN